MLYTDRYMFEGPRRLLCAPCCQLETTCNQEEGRQARQSGNSDQIVVLNATSRPQAKRSQTCMNVIVTVVLDGAELT